MNTKKAKLQSARFQKGATAVEYVLALSLVAIGIIGAKQGLEEKTTDLYKDSSSFLTYNGGSPIVVASVSTTPTDTTTTSPTTTDTATTTPTTTDTTTTATTTTTGNNGNGNGNDNSNSGNAKGKSK
jgi:Flp pilus assembly pilin Flp